MQVGANGCVQRLDLAEIFTMCRLKLKKRCKVGLETSKVCISLRNEHFQNAARGPLQYVGPGPSAPHFESVHFEKMRIGGGDPLIGVYLFT